MSHASNLILVEISPSRQQLLVLKHGRVVASRSERLEPAANTPGTPPARRWAEQLTRFRTTLATWVNELSLAGKHAVVVYTGPEEAAAVHSVPASSGLVSGRAAAELALGEAASYSLELATTHVVHLRTDDSPGVNADGSTRPAQLHHLGVIDSDHSLSAVCETIESAGLIPDRFVPGSAAMLVAAWTMVRERSAHHHSCVVVWIGEHGSALVGDTHERIAFARFLPVGCESVIDAAARTGPRTTTTPAAPGTDRAAIRESLTKHGVPTNADSPPDNATDYAVSLSAIRPVLQRLALEIKQSTRFGLSTAEREGVRVIVAGPGSRIPNLAAMLSLDAGIALEANAAAPETDAVPPIDGEADALIASRDSAINLLPRSRRERVRFAALRRGFRAGVAVAALAAALDAGQAYLTLQAEQHALTAQEQLAAAPSPARDAIRQASAARAGITQARARLKQFLPDAPSASGTLSLLASEVPDSIRLRTIDLVPDRGGWAVRISGVVLPDSSDTTPAPQRLRALFDRFAHSPIVTHATLGSTQITQLGDATQLSFDASIGLVGLPFESLAHPQTSAAQSSATEPETTGGRP